MKAKFELLDESNMDIEDLEVERDLQMAAVTAIRRARRFGTAYVIWEDGRIRQVPPDQTRPYEERLLARAENLNQRIKSLQPVNEDYSLNEKPTKGDQSK